MLKPTIIFISMATVMAGAAISPALGLIAKAFPEASPVVIKLLLTAPSLTIIPFSFVSSYLTTKIPKRTILLIGLFIYIVGGAGGQFLSTIELLLASRLLLGVGVGLVMPLSMSLIHDHFTGKERTQMMGYNSAFSNFGGIITVLIAGYLATYGWRLPFNVYLMGLLIMMMVFFFLPKDKVQEPIKHAEKAKMPFAVYGYAIAMGGVMLAYYSIATNMALYLEQNNFGGAALAGTVISFATVGGMITSLALVRIEMTFKQFVIPIMLLSMGLAFLILALTNTISLVMVAVCFVGLGQGALFPTIILKILNQVKPQHVDRAIALTSSFTYLGQFLSPVLLEGIGTLVNISTIRFQYGVLATAILIIVVINVAMLLKPKKVAV